MLSKLRKSQRPKVRYKEVQIEVVYPTIPKQRHSFSMYLQSEAMEVQSIPSNSTYSVIPASTIHISPCSSPQYHPINQASLYIQVLHTYHLLLDQTTQPPTQHNSPTLKEPTHESNEKDSPPCPTHTIHQNVCQTWSLAGDMRRLLLTFCVCLSDIITAGEVLLDGPNGTQCVAIIVQQ